MEAGFTPKYIYDTNEKVKNYVDHYCLTYGGHHKGISLEEALTHKIVQNQIQYYLTHDNEPSNVGQYPDFHDYN